MAMAPIARAEASYAAKSMAMAALVGVFSHIPRNPALSKSSRPAALQAFRILTINQEICNYYGWLFFHLTLR